MQRVTGIGGIFFKGRERNVILSEAKEPELTYASFASLRMTIRSRPLSHETRGADDAA